MKGWEQPVDFSENRVIVKHVQEHSAKRTGHVDGKGKFHTEGIVKAGCLAKQGADTVSGWWTEYGKACRMLDVLMKDQEKPQELWCVLC